MTDCGCDSIKGQHLTPYHQALEQLLDAATPSKQVEKVAVIDALRRVLASTLVSTIDVPPADNSAMDGYALISTDIVEGKRIPVSQRIAAGEVGSPLQTGTAARIFTGAPIPDNADVVVMQEQVTVDGDHILISGTHPSGRHIRRAAEDVAKGTAIFSPGVLLRAQELGVSASLGKTHLDVFKRIKVGVFFTGDELIEPGQPLGPGQIYDSNRYTIVGLLETLGCDIIDLGIIGDTLQATKDALQQASDKADLVITSGGVSVGEEDYIRLALEELGQLKMWKIKIKPGKPLAFGQINQTPFLGLPGNPVAAFVTFCLFVSPFIKRMQGRKQTQTRSIPVAAGFSWPRPGKRREFVRARIVQNLCGQSVAEIYSNQGSGVLASTCWAEGLVMVADGTTVAEGDLVEYTPFTEYFS